MDNSELTDFIRRISGPSPRTNPNELSEDKFLRLLEDLKDEQLSTEEDPNDPFID